VCQSLPDPDTVKVVAEVHVDTPEIVRQVELDLHVSMLSYGAGDHETRIGVEL